MGQFYSEIPGFLIPWINAQKIFWVATAPLAEDGHVNVSPKGFENTMNVVLDSSDSDFRAEEPGSSTATDGTSDKKTTSRSVWYEDLTGSGIETISHLRENGRITIMFTAFEGPPRIVRLFGTGKVYEFGTPEYDALLPPEKRQPGSRAAIWIDVHKVGSSCGYSIPFFDYKSPRMRLHTFALNREQQDYDHYCEQEKLPQSPPESQSNPSKVNGNEVATTPPSDKGMKNYWGTRNLQSIDGLPGLLFAFTSGKPLGDWRTRGVFFSPDDESSQARVKASNSGGLLGDLGKVLVGFGAGVVLTATILVRLHK